jgi:hypothetical protein
MGAFIATGHLGPTVSDQTLAEIVADTCRRCRTGGRLRRPFTTRGVRHRGRRAGAVIGCHGRWKSVQIARRYIHLAPAGTTTPLSSYCNRCAVSHRRAYSSTVRMSSGYRASRWLVLGSKPFCAGRPFFRALWLRCERCKSAFRGISSSRRCPSPSRHATRCEFASGACGVCHSDMFTVMNAWPRYAPSVVNCVAKIASTRCPQ